MNRSDVGESIIVAVAPPEKGGGGGAVTLRLHLPQALWRLEV